MLDDVDTSKRYLMKSVDWAFIAQHLLYGRLIIYFLKFRSLQSFNQIGLRVFLFKCHLALEI